MKGPFSDGADLRGYVAVKQEIAEIVRETLELFEADQMAQAVEDCRDLMVRLAEDRFNLAVVGQFKRGKSTLMNAVVGRQVLPSGILPLTSVVTALCYGPREAVWLRRRGWTFEQQIPLAELGDYVTESGNPSNEKGLVEARVELPLPFLRRGLYFVDTPGVGSAESENAATTYAFLPKADAVIFVTSVEASPSEAEERFLRDVREHVRRIFIVVNKVDLLEASERDEVLGYITRRVAQILDVPDHPVFPLSARQALEARAGRNGAALRDSGLPAFEAALGTFLTEDQGRTFLAGTLDRLLILLADEVGPVVPAEGRDGDQRRRTELRDRASAVQAALLAGNSIKDRIGAGPVASADVGILTRAISRSQARQPARHPAHPLRIGTCDVCEAQSGAVFDFFVQWQHELATNGPACRAFVAARGFCAGHTWQFQQIAAPRDLSAGYAPFLGAAIDELQHTVDDTPRQAADRVGELLQAADHCTACRVLHDAERYAIGDLVARLATPKAGSAETRDPALCLGHLRSALASDPAAEVGLRLIRAQIGRLGELVEDLRSLALKRGAGRSGLVNAAESNAWYQALVQVAGERTARAMDTAGEAG